VSLLVLGAGGLLSGIAFRWWALGGAVVIGIWAGAESELEVPGWYIGLVYAGAFALGVVVGAGLRRWRASTSRP
jgi:hypothetical protein